MIFRKIYLRFKWMWQDFLDKLGLSFKSDKRKGEVQVICFHGVCRDEQEYINGRFLKESHMRFLLEAISANFNVLSMEDFRSSAFDPSRLNVLLTFDDGYKNNREILFPIIEELGLPVVLFVTANTNAFWMDLLDIIQAEKLPMDLVSGKFGETKLFSNSDFKKWMMTQPKEVVKQITDSMFVIAEPVLNKYREFHELLGEYELIDVEKNPLVTIGNHSMCHHNFAQMTAIEIENDVFTCSEYLKGILGGDNFVFAYPFGLYTPESIERLKALGYVQFISAGNPNYKGEAIDRLVINPFISVRNQLIAIRNGKY